MTKSLEEKISKIRWPIFIKLHNIFLSINPNINYRIFPLYTVYFLEDTVLAIIFFQGKLVYDEKGDQLDVGFSFKKKPNIPNLIDAGYMRYPGINYSIKFNSGSKITVNLTKLIKSSIFIPNN